MRVVFWRQGIFTEFNEKNNRAKFVYFAFNNLTAGQMNKTTKERQED